MHILGMLLTVQQNTVTFLLLLIVSPWIWLDDGCGEEQMVTDDCESVVTVSEEGDDDGRGVGRYDEEVELAPV